MPHIFLSKPEAVIKSTLQVQIKPQVGGGRTREPGGGRTHLLGESVLVRGFRLTAHPVDHAARHHHVNPFCCNQFCDLLMRTRTRVQEWEGASHRTTSMHDWERTVTNAHRAFYWGREMKGQSMSWPSPTEGNFRQLYAAVKGSCGSVVWLDFVQLVEANHSCLSHPTPRGGR